MRALEPLMLEAFAFAADEAAAAAVSGSGGKTSWPDYPGERPQKDALLKWTQAWTDDITSIGFAPLLRGEDPYELSKLAPRELIPAVAADAPSFAAIVSKNADIAHSNAINAKEREARLLEMKSRMGGKIARAMRSTAPIKLKSLQSACVLVKAEDGKPAAHDGIAMFMKLCEELDEGLSEGDSKRYEKMYDVMKNSRLPDNSSPDAWSQVINPSTCLLYFVDDSRLADADGRYSAR